MHYSFTNSEKMKNLLETQCFDELEKEFVKTKIHVVREGWGAVIQYKTICNAYFYARKDLPESISNRAVELFSEIWSIEALSMIRTGHGKYGTLSARAMKVLAEYENYRAKAIEMYVKTTKRDFFEEEITDTVDNVPITIRCVYGRLSLFRKGMEYVIFYSED